MADTFFTAPPRDIYSVTRLNGEVRTVLEGSFPLLWVEGEISNLARPSSGHIYFSLKDASCQVRCAMFRLHRLRMRFAPDNGQHVLVRARVGLYEGRGEFQLVIEHMELFGEGALRQAFEELKSKLATEGLFVAEHKKPLPTLPRQIGVITSPSGAALRDVMSVLRRRFPSIPLLIYPVQVQGSEAPRQICTALQLAQARGECDVLILCRGGGSLEDLSAFNDESVARAIHACTIPVVCGVGHEIDFTIADFVADRRAPTPSAAAEMVAPERSELTKKVFQLAHRVDLRFRQILLTRRDRLSNLNRRLRLLHPRYRLHQRQQRLDELEQRAFRAIGLKLHRVATDLEARRMRLRALSPSHRLRQFRLVLDNIRREHFRGMLAGLSQLRQRLSEAAKTLDAVSPLATLGRGYSITRRQDGHSVLRDSAEVHPGDHVETLLARGRILCEVRACRDEGLAPRS